MLSITRINKILFIVLLIFVILFIYCDFFKYSIYNNFRIEINSILNQVWRWFE